MKPETFKITLPVKPHIRKYLHILYGYPVQIDQNKLLGNIVIPLLQKKSLTTGLAIGQRMQRHVRLTALVECHATMYRFQDYGIHITPNHIIVINRIMENQFDDDLYKWVLNKTAPDGRYKGYNDALRSFMAHYCIEEDVDISFDTLKKAEYRRRVRIEYTRKKLLHTFVPTSFSHQKTH